MTKYFLCVYCKDGIIQNSVIMAYDIVHAGRMLQKIKSITANTIISIQKLDQRTTFIPFDQVEFSVNIKKDKKPHDIQEIRTNPRKTIQ